MIVAEIGDRIRVVTQNDHAALAADLLGLWRYGGIADHPLRQEVLWATREHDNGWRESDASPLPRTDFGIVDFRGIPDPLRQEIWLRGTARSIEQNSLAGALIAQHNLDLHAEQRNDPGWGEFFSELDDWVLELEQDNERLGEIRNLYPHLQRADSLSLALCQSQEFISLPGGYTAQKMLASDSETEVFRVNPFPFAGATRFRVAARWMENQYWQSSTDLVSTLTRCRWKTQQFLLQP